MQNEAKLAKQHYEGMPGELSEGELVTGHHWTPGHSLVPCDQFLTSPDSIQSFNILAALLHATQ